MVLINIIIFCGISIPLSIYWISEQTSKVNYTILRNNQKFLRGFEDVCGGLRMFVAVVTTKRLTFGTMSVMIIINGGIVVRLRVTLYIFWNALATFINMYEKTPRGQ